jgi:rhamnogalacturonan endolyase
MTVSLLALLASLTFGTRNMEWLDRGLVAVSTGTNTVYLSWRLLAPEMDAVSGFNVYRGGTRITSVPVTTSTNYTDNSGSLSATYTVRAVTNGVEEPDSPPREGLAPPVAVHSPPPSRLGNDAGRLLLHLQRQRRLGGRSGRRRAVRTGVEMGPVEFEGQLPERLYR